MAEPWILFGDTNPATLIAPGDPGVYDLKVEATNANGTTTVELENALVVNLGSLPVAAFTLASYRFERGDVSFPNCWERVLSNDSLRAEAYSWRLEGPNFAVSFDGAIPPPFQMPGLGTFTLSLTAINAYGVHTAYARISVLSGTELRGAWSTRNTRLRGTFPANPTRLRGTWGTSLTSEPDAT